MKIIKESLLFLLLISFNNCIIVIPFKTFIKEEPVNFTVEDVINYWEPNIIYSDSSIGNPPQKINIILNCQSFSTTLFQKMCDLKNSFYLKEKSSTFNYEKPIYFYSSMKNASLINETLYFYDNFNLKEKKPFNNMKIIYSDNEEEDSKEKNQYHENTCINIGLQLGWTYIYDYQVNFINQLKKNYKILETYDFSLKYNSDNEGIIVIGDEPHIYDPNNYYELQYRMVGALGENSGNDKDWFLHFDKLYYPYKVKSNGRIINETIGLVKTLRIQFDMGIVLGPNEYKDMIKRHFFNDLIKAGKCFEETIIDKRIEKTIFYCDKSAENDIKNDFPTLYFEMKQFNKIFELNYKDLFREKNGKIFFLIYFSEFSSREFFTIGKILLRKYFLTFNQDSKMIGYYNEDLPGGKKKNSDKKEEENFSIISNKYFLIIIIILLIIIFGILGFYLGKIVYNKVRKKRINEVEDNYDYNPQENLDSNNHDNNNSNNVGINDN